MPGFFNLSFVSDQKFGHQQTDAASCIFIMQQRNSRACSLIGTNIFPVALLKNWQSEVPVVKITHIFPALLHTPFL